MQIVTQARRVGMIAIFLGWVLYAQGAMWAGEPIRIMPLGDSITAGAQFPGGYRVDLWQLFVANDINMTFVGSQVNGPPELGSRNHEGHSGWIISQIHKPMEDWLDRFQPQIVLLMIGTNDVNRRIDLDQAPDRLAALIDKITERSPDTNLVVAQIIPIRDPAGDERAQAYNAAIPDLVEARAAQGKLVTLVDMHSALGPEDLYDNLHPNLGGYSKMAHVWYDAVVSILFGDKSSR